MPTNTTTPNMSLINPTVGLEPGPQFASDISNDLVILDAHNHTLGSGVQITPAGLNINAALSLNDNILDGAQALNFTVQSGDAASQSIYMKGVDFWVTDGNGASFAITAAGAVLATSSGISSGTATAAFAAGVLVVDSNSLTPANIQAGSILLGNNVASSKFLTLSPPNAMGANYSLVLPTIPASTRFLSIDNSGNIASSVAVAGGITSANIASGTITGANIATSTIQQSNLAGRGINSGIIGGVAVANNCGVFSSSSGTYAIVTDQDIGLLASGIRPAIITFSPSATFTSSSINTIGSSGTVFRILNVTTGTVLGSFPLNSQVFAPVWTLIDIAPNAGNNRYVVQAIVASGTVVVTNYNTFVYEL